MMPLFRLFIAPLVLCMTTTAYAVSDDPPKSNDVKPAKEEKKEQQLVEKPITVTLLEVGAEPYGTLRYNMSVGDTQRFVVAHRNTSTQVVLGMTTPPTRDPEFRAMIESSVQSVDESGVITLAMRIVHAEAIERENAPPPTHAQRRAVNAMSGKEAEVKLTQYGVIQSQRFTSTLTGPAGLLLGAPHEIIEKAIRTAIVAFPEAQIGIGAQWRADETRRENGIYVERSITYTFKGRTDNHLELAVEVNERAEPQPVDIEWQQTLKLTRYNGRNVGAMTHHLSGLLPGRFNSEGKSDMEVQVGAHRMSQNVESVSNVTPPAKKQVESDAEKDGESKVDQ